MSVIFLCLPAVPESDSTRYAARNLGFCSISKHDDCLYFQPSSELASQAPSSYMWYPLLRSITVSLPVLGVTSKFNHLLHLAMEYKDIEIFHFAGTNLFNLEVLYVLKRGTPSPQTSESSWRWHMHVNRSHFQDSLQPLRVPS